MKNHFLGGECDGVKENFYYIINFYEKKKSSFGYRKFISRIFFSLVQSFPLYKTCLRKLMKYKTPKLMYRFMSESQMMKYEFLLKEKNTITFCLDEGGRRMSPNGIKIIPFNLIIHEQNIL